MLESMSIEMIERILKELPVNIFFKDVECKYVFSSHYWNHLRKDDSKDWNIRGKSSDQIRKDDKSANRSYEMDRRIIETGESVSYTTEVEADGEKQCIEVSKHPVRDDDGNIIGIVGIVIDITKKKEMERQLELYAQTDTLTGLFNRRYLDYWTQEKCMESMYPLSVISADCDGLKRINDTYGHNAGDELIRSATSLFRVCMPEGTVLFRMGGDEFMMLLPNTTLTRAEELIEMMQRGATTMHVYGQPVSISYGAAVFDGRNGSIESAIRKADERMYEDKQEHKTRRRS